MCSLKILQSLKLNKLAVLSALREWLPEWLPFAERQT